LDVSSSPRGSESHALPPDADRLLRNRTHRSNDVTRGNAVPVEQLFGLAAARDLANGEAMNGQPGIRDRRRDRVTDAARRVVILDGDQVSTRGAPGGDQRLAIDRRDGIEID